MPIEFIGMIGVRPEGAGGAAGHVSGGEIGPTRSTTRRSGARQNAATARPPEP
jgi:hypothetical protein